MVGVRLLSTAVHALRGSRLSVLEAFGRISSSALPASSRCSHWEIWTLRLCPRIFQPLFWCLGVACGVQRIGCFGRSCVLATCGYMFFEKIWNNFSHFLRCGELESRNVWPPFFLNESVHSRCFWLGHAWWDSGYMIRALRQLPEVIRRISHTLCGAVGLVSCSVVSVLTQSGDVCAQPTLQFLVFFALLTHGNLSIISTSAPFLTVWQHFSSPR